MLDEQFDRRTNRPASRTLSARPVPTPSRASAVRGADASAARLIDTVPAVMDAIRRAMRRHVDADTSVPRFRCLNFVARRPGCTIGEVAAFLGVTMPTASATVDRLVRAGALRTRPDDADRRRTLLEATPAGTARLARIRRGAQAEVARRLAALEPDELAALDAVLELLRRVARED